MKTRLRSIYRKLVFKGLVPKTFYATRISLDLIKEKVFLISGNNELEISRTHCVVCHAPFMTAVWIPGKQAIHFDAVDLKIEIRDHASVLTKINISRKRKITIENGHLAVFEINEASCFQLPYWHQYFLLKRYFLFKKKDTFLEGKIYSAMYSYPRQVIAVSYRDHEYFNIFPMDFQCFIREQNLYIIGLRTTNVTVEKMIQSGKFVVADTDGASLEIIYQLGRNHSAAPPKIEDLPFEVVNSESHQFPVPDFSSSYKEIEVVANYQLGTHMLIVGKAINSVQLKEGNSSIFHIHFFQFAQGGYKELSEKDTN
jgi:flavin reductase (DIM6/NTAB) family NADH-FMN oxidoreductase RutF